jgi:hypothetical protein
MYGMVEFYFDVPQGRLVRQVGTTALNGEHPENASIVPLYSIVTAAEFPDDTPYEKLDSNGWDRERCIAFGKWAVQALDEGPERPPQQHLTREHLRRLHALGLGPPDYYVRSTFKTMAGFREAVGIHPGRERGRYDDWSFPDFAAYAARVERSVGGRPRDADYKSWSHAYADAPGLRTILDRIGGIRALNELIGYPDIKNWDNDDYVRWGVQVLDANDEGCVLTAPLIDILSARKRGPHSSNIDKRFGVRAFQQMVAEQRETERAQAAEATKEWASYYDLLLKQQRIKAPERAAADGIPLPDDKKATIAMRFRVAAQCLPDIKESMQATIARSSESLIKLIRQRNTTVTAGHIEMVADSLGIFNHLWPLPPTPGLHVSADEIAAVRERRRRYVSHSRRSKRAV